MPSPEKTPKQIEREKREERIAKALRNNLRRRKAAVKKSVTEKK